MSKTIHPRLTVLRRHQVEIRTGLARSSIYALIAEGQFPAPIRLSAHTVGWLEHEINNWIAERTKASRHSISSGALA